MKTSLDKSTRMTHGPTWHELARHLALHINWLHQSAPQTRTSRTKIERWRRQLATFPDARTTERARRGGQG
jgi:hypothetical protein